MELSLAEIRPFELNHFFVDCLHYRILSLCNISAFADFIVNSALGMCNIL